MRHNRDRRQLSRTHEHRRALLRNLVTALFEHERIETSVAKAKETRRVAERMITFAKKGDLHARRNVAAYVKSDEVVKKLFETIVPWYADRNGGYTRIIKLKRRQGDGGEMGVLELIKSKELMEEERRERAEKREAKQKAKEEKRKLEEEAAQEELRAEEAREESEAEGPSEEKGEKGEK
ncbi:MAG: 50S ribosomal protein L17 [Candidatus Eiseniibacteriota bacterium]|nr:MAG: 50S ribosomal protein L17 [Candidatus Eisenbacteria bacterium]